MALMRAQQPSCQLQGSFNTVTKRNWRQGVAIFDQAQQGQAIGVSAQAALTTQHPLGYQPVVSLLLIPREYAARQHWPRLHLNRLHLLIGLELPSSLPVALIDIGIPSKCHILALVSRFTLREARMSHHPKACPGCAIVPRLEWHCGLAGTAGPQGDIHGVFLGDARSSN